MSERITFRLSPIERKSLDEKAKERGLKLSLLCRLIVMRRKIPDRSPQTLQWLRDLVGMQNNLNQIAHHLNITKESDQWAIEAIGFIAEEVKKAKTILTVNNYEQSI
ncbi:MAG: MobC family plasmid mobilization relaxosome protein [Muribaculaceae bacterium]|nr:MobC family plasmid mobilization relaxosome protein [Muribaculaceae bacterium]